MSKKTRGVVAVCFGIGAVFLSYSNGAGIGSYLFAGLFILLGVQQLTAADD